MTTYTKATLAADVLRDLGAVGADDAAPGGMTTFALRRITVQLEELAERGQVDWDITGQIPAERYDALIQIMMPIIGPSVGKTVNPNIGPLGRHKLARGIAGETSQGETARDY